MKKISFALSLFLVVILAGCMSTTINPNEIEYKEISAEKFLRLKDSELWSLSRGYKVTDVYVLFEYNSVGADYKRSKIKASKTGIDRKEVDFTDFAVKTNPNDPTWRKRMLDKYNGHYTVWLYGKKEGDWFNGYTYKIIVYDIDGVPTQEQLDADKAAEEAERLAQEAARVAKEEAEKKAKAEKQKARNDKAKALAKGYVYHGIEENDRSRKLFTGGALEVGHAYYISGFVVKYGGTMAAIEYGDGFFFSSRSSAVSVDYIDQKVKGDVVEAGITTLFGKTIESPLNVVITGGKTALHMPVVIGLVE